MYPQDFKRAIASERIRPKDEREIIHLLKPFARFHSKIDHDNLVRAIIDEHRIRKRIEKLKVYLAEGLRTKAEIDAYEAKKRRKLA